MPAIFLGFDTIARGAGSRNLGRHGYTHVGPSTTPVIWTPGGGGLSFSWAAGTAAATDFASAADPPRYLLLPDGVSTTSRAITRAFNPALRGAATVSDGAWRVASIYSFAASTVRQTVEVRLPGAGAVLASYTVPVDFQLGLWLRFAFDESVDIQFTQVSGGGAANCAGIFIDPFPTHLAGPPPSNAFGHFAY